MAAAVEGLTIHTIGANFRGALGRLDRHTAFAERVHRAE
jgi:hypothetical protein